MPTAITSGSNWVLNAQGTYLKWQHTRHLRNSVKELRGMQDFAKTMPDQAMAQSIVDKLESKIQLMIDQYGEEHHEDGSVLVRHPGIGFITVNHVVLDEPVRLFASKVKSLSTNMVVVYRADALVKPSGVIEYINRQEIVRVEMSHSAYSELMANPGRGHYPATIRSLFGDAVEYEGDLNWIRAKLVYDEALSVTEGLEKWANGLLKGVDDAIAKGGVMSKRDREALVKDAETLRRWTESNPAFYAKRLAEFSDTTTQDIKLEVMSVAGHKVQE